jgi:alpha-D-xyloside xylohydrolase
VGRTPLARMLRQAAFAVSLAGCGGGDDAANGPGEPGIRSGRYRVFFDEKALALKLLRERELLLEFPADGLELGAVDQLEDTANYDPYPLIGAPPAQAGPRWLGVTGVRKVTYPNPSSLAIELELAEDQAATLNVRVSGDGRFEAKWSLADSALELAYFRLRPRVDPSEGFYGLGEVFDSVEHRGKVRAMQLELDLGLEGSNNEAHVPVPFVIGTRGWGLFVESPYPAAFDVAATESDRLAAVFGTGTATREGLLFHLFAAEHPLDVTKRYYDTTGYPRLPARWALGPLIWRDENRDQAQVEADLAAIRDLDLATTGVWIDRPYATAVNTFDFDASRFPDPGRMIGLARDLGFRMALWHTPYLDPASEATRSLRDEAAANGYFPLQTGLLLSNWGPPIDFTHSGAYAFWQELIRRYTAIGIEGFKLDYGEDVAPGLPGVRNVFRFADGSDERTMHNLYQLLYHRVYAETLPAEGGFLLCRSGKYGDQVHGCIVWPGDLDASFALHGDPNPNGARFVGGLPASLIAGLSLGPSGFPFYGSDTGGYRHCPPDKETFMRWFQQTALSTVMQVGTSCNDVAWEPTPENGFDQQTLDEYRRYARLHLRLWPYLWTHAQRLAGDGRPIQRALGLAHPELGIHPSDTYLLGDHLLVAPVVERGRRERDVVFPSRYVDWFSGAAYEPGTHRVAAPLEVLPLFLREGGIVPLLRPTIDTLNPTTDPARVDSFATTPGVLYARVAPGPRSTFTVFDATELGQKSEGGAVELSYRAGTEFREGALFEVIAFGGKPREVLNGGTPLAELGAVAELEGRASGWAFDDAAGGTVYVKVPAAEARVRVAR